MRNQNPNLNYGAPQGSLQSNNPHSFSHNLTNYYSKAFNPNDNSQSRQNPYMPNANYNPYLQQQNVGPIGANGGIGVLVYIYITELFEMNTIYESFSAQRLIMHSFFNHVQ